LALDSGGTPYVAGWFQWISAFGTNLLQAQGYQDVFLAKLVDRLEFCCLSASNGLFEMRLKGVPGETAVVESSLDLTNWFLWQTHTLPTGGLPLSIPMGTNQHLFFRARIP
ncbi:MAG TPA: hypothetical protein P5186_25215, partial [Candidatus Paceibacterota bacterium]|nr:hypothetical protein [Verrucomicrobiota bacterium]HRY51364.1 hypothetical protein [Candidatus Paceibacterota bacterium]